MKNKRHEIHIAIRNRVFHKVIDQSNYYHYNNLFTPTYNIFSSITSQILIQTISKS